MTREGRARRRYNCGKQGEWDERAETAVGLLTEHSDLWKTTPSGRLTVADFGAGNERLRGLIENRLDCDIDYRPYDLHPQLPTTKHLDVGVEIPDTDFDVVFCLGLLEYLGSVEDLARRLHGVCRHAIVTYVTSDSPVAISYEDRVRHGWTTHLQAREVEAAFGRGGFRLIGTGTSDGEATRHWLWAAEAGGGS